MKSLQSLVLRRIFNQLASYAAFASAAFATTALLSANAQAQSSDYPNKPIKLVVPFPVGGSSDAMGRLIADRLGPLLKTTVIVENKAGAGGMIGTDAVAKLPADGYSLVLVDVFIPAPPFTRARCPMTL